MVKRTPDGISKKRQEIKRQIDVWESKIKDLAPQISLMPDKSKQLTFATEQLIIMQKALKDTQKLGRGFNLNFRKKLYLGVY